MSRLIIDDSSFTQFYRGLRILKQVQIKLYFSGNMENCRLCCAPSHMNLQVIADYETVCELLRIPLLMPFVVRVSGSLSNHVIRTTLFSMVVI